MNVDPLQRHIAIVDLTERSPIDEDVARLRRMPVLSDELKAIEELTAEEFPRRRMPVMVEAFRKLETPQAAGLLRTAARLALDNETPGLRLLGSFLEVKRPGVEVLKQLGTLASLERVSLRLLHGSWAESVEHNGDATHPIVEMFEDAGRAGVLAAGIPGLPRKPESMRTINRHLRNWVHRMTRTLEQGRPLTDNDMLFLTQLCMLEINLMERRVSRLASKVNPYDGRSIARLMPILSFYDQDIEHLKGVVSRLVSYKPFYERLLTMEHVLSGNEVDKLQRLLLREAHGRAAGRLLENIRLNPVLDRELAFLASAVYQVALLRQEALGGGDPPDILSILHKVISAVRDEPKLNIVIEPDLARRLFPQIEEWGFVHLLPDVFVVSYREERAPDFVHPDGTPSLPERPGEKPIKPTSIRDLIQRQMSNDAFLVGILENTRIAGLPGIVPMIAVQTRSIRVLDKIISSRWLITGPANKDVPRLILTNPTRVPMLSMKSLINVRYVSRVDLERLARPTAETRPEVRNEILAYLKLLKS